MREKVKSKEEKKKEMRKIKVGEKRVRGKVKSKGGIKEMLEDEEE